MGDRPLCRQLGLRLSARAIDSCRRSRTPRWGPDAPRAFRFPVLCPFSTIDIAVMDTDDTSDDDPIGHTCIDLSQIGGQTVYDVWAPLQFSELRPNHGERGSLRLRYSVVWREDRLRLLHYPKLAPTFVVPFRSARDLRNSVFAVHGRNLNPAQFRWRALKAHMLDLDRAFWAFYAQVLGFLFWDDPLARCAGNESARLSHEGQLERELLGGRCPRPLTTRVHPHSLSPSPAPAAAVSLSSPPAGYGRGNESVAHLQRALAFLSSALTPPRMPVCTPLCTPQPALSRRLPAAHRLPNRGPLRRTGGPPPGTRADLPDAPARRPVRPPVDHP